MKYNELNLKHTRTMKKETTVTDHIGKALDSRFGTKKAYLVKGLCFFTLGLIVVMVYLTLVSRTVGTNNSIFDIALTQIQITSFWYKVGIGLLLGSSGVALMFFRLFPWSKKNPGKFTFIFATISLILAFVGLNSKELGFLLAVFNTATTILIIGYFAKPAYDNWKEIKIFNRKQIKEYKEVGEESMPYVQKN